MDEEIQIKKNNFKKKIKLIIYEKVKKIQFTKKKKNYCKLIIKLVLLINYFFYSFFFFIKNYKRTEIPSRKDFIFILCMFGKDILKSNDRIRKYFYTLDKFVQNSKIVLAVSEFTKIESSIIKYQNIEVCIERFGNVKIKDIEKKYKYPGASHYFYSGMRPSFYKHYLRLHPEIKYVAISDDDTLFFRDPFLLIAEDPSVVHIMEDVYPFSVTDNGNYIWTNAWVNLNNSTKLKCGFKLLNNNLLSKKIKDLIPLNSGMMIGSSKNIIKISELISSRFKCPGMFPNNAEQGLLNYLDLSGELKELGFPIHRHNLFNGSLLSCPDYLPLKNYIHQIKSNHLIAVHHHQLLNSSYIVNSPLLFQAVFNITF